VSGTGGAKVGGGIARQVFNDAFLPTFEENHHSSRLVSHFLFAPLCVTTKSHLTFFAHFMTKVGL
jgi:hypothetical protein